jgi:putative peptidoglycan lipid II flippase
MGHGGIALADSISATLNMSLLLGVFAGRHGLPWVRELALPSLRPLAAALAMGGVVLAARYWLAGALAGPLLPSALALLIIIALATVVYMIACRILRVAELDDVLAALPFRRRGPEAPR